MLKKVLILTALFFLASTVCVVAQESGCVDTLEMKISFQSHNSAFDIYYHNNEESVDKFLDQIALMTLKEGYSLKKFIVYGSSSLEGRTDLNKKIRDKRSNNIVSYFKKILSLSDDIIVVESDDVDWSGLIDAVENTRMEYKDEVLDILINTPEWIRNADGVIVDGRKRQLQMLCDGKVWWYMYDNIFPTLRNSTVQAVLEREADAIAKKDPVKVEEELDVIHLTDTIINIVIDTVRFVKTVTVVDTVYVRDTVVVEKEPITYKENVYPSPNRYPVFAFRTNLLLPLLNIGIEIPMSNTWSFGADFYYPSFGHRKDYTSGINLLAGIAEFRYWIGEKHSRGKENRMYRLTGHSIGLYAGSGKYDFLQDYVGLKGTFYSGGFDYLCSLPVAQGKLFMEFSISAGFIFSNKHKYNVQSVAGSYIINDGEKERFTYFGPTKASIALVVPIYVKR